MADYTAEELVSPSDVATVGSPFGVITSGDVVTGGDISTVGSPVVPILGEDLIRVRPIIYRFRGYYAGESAYEFWTGVSLDTPNPSGNPLVDKTVDTVFDC